MKGRQTVEAALTAWRDAERRLYLAASGDAAEMAREVETHRDEYQRLTAANMNEWMAQLDEAEGRRANATPSSLPFHEAARDTQEIASQIWEAARSSDEDTPAPSSTGERRVGPWRPGHAEPTSLRLNCKA